MRLIDLFEEYGYISCNCAPEEADFIKHADEDGLDFEVGIDGDFLNDMRKGDYPADVGYPVVYCLDDNDVITTTSDVHYNARKLYYALIAELESPAIEINDLL